MSHYLWHDVVIILSSRIEKPTKKIYLPVELHRIEGFILWPILKDEIKFQSSNGGEE